MCWTSIPENIDLSDSKVDDGVRDILRERDWAKKLTGLRSNQHPQAQFLWATFRDVFHYCALQLEHIANNARDLDFAVRWGFGWDSGPFGNLASGGWQQVASWISIDIAAGKRCLMYHYPLGRQSRIVWVFILCKARIPCCK
ncbi:MAG: hypothetical protein WDM70_10795 [Nitrosomonadales bacterium]